MGAPDARHQPRLLLELLRAWLGRLVGLGSGGKCFTDAVADRHGIDAQSRGDREAGSLQDLDGFPRHSDFFTFYFGHVPRAFGRSDECSCFCVRPGPRHVYSYFPRDCDRRVLPAFCLAGRLGRIGGVLLGTVARIAPHGKQSAPRRRYGDRALRHALSAFPGCCRRRPHHRGRAVL